MKNNFFFKKQFSNIYKKASRNSEVTSQILYGEKFKILSNNKEWVKIKSSFDNYIWYKKNKDYFVNSDSINSKIKNFVGYFLHGLKLKSYEFNIYKSKKNKKIVSVNIIGNKIINYRDKKYAENEFLFDYLKKEIKEKRKMGHLTTLIS